MQFLRRNLRDPAQGVGAAALTTRSQFCWPHRAGRRAPGRGGVPFFNIHQEPDVCQLRLAVGAPAACRRVGPALEISRRRRAGGGDQGQTRIVVAGLPVRWRPAKPSPPSTFASAAQGYSMSARARPDGPDTVDQRSRRWWNLEMGVIAGLVTRHPRPGSRDPEPHCRRRAIPDAAAEFQASQRNDAHSGVVPNRTERQHHGEPRQTALPVGTTEPVTWVLSSSVPEQDRWSHATRQGGVPGTPESRSNATGQRRPPCRPELPQTPQARRTPASKRPAA